MRLNSTMVQFLQRSTLELEGNQTSQFHYGSILTIEFCIEQGYDIYKSQFHACPDLQDGSILTVLHPIFIRESLRSQFHTRPPFSGMVQFLP
jgi:hypothetical protein